MIRQTIQVSKKIYFEGVGLRYDLLLRRDTRCPSPSYLTIFRVPLDHVLLIDLVNLRSETVFLIVYTSLTTLSKSSPFSTLQYSLCDLSETTPVYVNLKYSLTFNVNSSFSIIYFLLCVCMCVYV